MSIIKFWILSQQKETTVCIIYLFILNKITFTCKLDDYFSLMVFSLYLLFQDHGSVIKAIYSGSEFLESASAGNEVGIVLETTSFYAEQGGQVLCTYHSIQWLFYLFWSTLKTFMNWILLLRHVSV